MHNKRFANCLIAIVMSGLAMTSAATDFALPDWKRRVASEQSVDEITRLYIELLLENNPVLGAQIGIHGNSSNPRYYDQRLPDVSTDAWLSGYEAHRFLLDRLRDLDREAMSKEDQIDHHILQNQVERELLDVTLLGAMTNPLTYVGMLGGGFAYLTLRDYAPIETRLQSFGDRCGATPLFLDQTRAALSPPYVQPTAMQKKTTLMRLRGMTESGGTFDNTLGDLLATADLNVYTVAAISAACDAASESIGAFADWFEQSIMPRADGDWRLGPDLYTAKYRLYMDYPLGPDELLAAAESKLQEVHAELVEIARRVHDEYLAGAEVFQPAIELTDQQVVRAVFSRLAEDRSTVDSLIEDSYAMTDSIVRFVKQINLMDLPATSKLRIEKIPPHLSGYAVAQIVTAPVFEPHLESVWFWDLDFLSTYEDYLKEYNRTALALVYIHEGVPGHFVQLEYSNRFDRITPKLFKNGPMVEGWASYIESQIVDQGFTIYPDQPYGYDLQQLTNRKLQLRSIINAIIDIRLHTTGWPEEEAVRLMMDKGFQEEGEARGKLTRAKLSSVQLATYFAGHEAILGLLDEYRYIQGDAFSWKAFNEKLVGAGSPPFFVLRDHMLSPD